MPSLQTTRNKPRAKKVRLRRQRKPPAQVSYGYPSLEFAKRTLAVIQSLRPEQWIKNLLLFVPLIASHQFADFQKLLGGVAGFFAFSFCASGIYVINDWADVAADQRHSVKRRRPIAAGTVPLLWCPWIAAGSLMLGLMMGTLWVSVAFLHALLVYVALATIYTTHIKKIVGLDVLALAGFYTLRLVAGGIATQTTVSQWLMAFSILFFASLALVKRYAELKRLSECDAAVALRRGYRVDDWKSVRRFGLAIGYLSVVVLGAYLLSENATRLYRNQWALWLVCPLVMLWLRRMWAMADARQLNEDPVLLAVKDKLSWCLAVITLVLIIISGPQ